MRLVKFTHSNDGVDVYINVEHIWAITPNTNSDDLAIKRSPAPGNTGSFITNLAGHTYTVSESIADIMKLL